MDFESFIAMNGYALYVWGAYGAGLLAYGALLIWALIQQEKIKTKLGKK